MIEQVFTECRGVRQEHHDVEIPVPPNVTIATHDGTSVNITLTGTRKQMERFLHSFAAKIEKAAK